MQDQPAAQPVVVRKPNEYRTMDLVRRRNPIFFAKDILAHYGTLIESPVHDKGLFITSEKIADLNLDRAYTVRRAMDFYDEGKNVFRPNIVNVAGGFMEHATLAKAQAALEAYLILLNLSGRPLLAAMSRSVGKAAGFTAMTSMTGGFTLICADSVDIMEIQRAGNVERDNFSQKVCRIDFRSVSEAKKVLSAGTAPVPETWIASIIHTARGLPLGPVSFN